MEHSYCLSREVMFPGVTQNLPSEKRGEISLMSQENETTRKKDDRYFEEKYFTFCAKASDSVKSVLVWSVIPEVT